MAKGEKKYKYIHQQKEYKESKEKQAAEPEEKVRRGVCPKCEHGSFTLAMNSGDLHRKCKKCGLEENTDKMGAEK